MKTFEFEINKKKTKVHAENIGGKIWMHYNGRTVCVETASKKKKSDTARDTSGVLKAPMPGKILKIFVKLGQDVQAGQVLVVMEAMKMEYSIISEVAGKVKSISCQENLKVTLGDTLIVVGA